MTGAQSLRAGAFFEDGAEAFEEGGFTLADQWLAGDGRVWLADARVEERVLGDFGNGGDGRFAGAFGYALFDGDGGGDALRSSTHVAFARRTAGHRRTWIPWRRCLRREE